MKERADKVLTDLGLVSSRSQAKSLIEKGDVTVNGHIIKKAGELVDRSGKIEINAPLFVGRGAFKLEKALEVFSVNPSGKICMDVGASTGGFTEVLLSRGALKVYAIDVGSGQLAQKLRDDARVVNLENTNIRELTLLEDEPVLAVMDLSFISITKVLDQVFSLLAKNAEMIALVKPQFEVGREHLPKDGVVKDVVQREAALVSVIDFAEAHGWLCRQKIESPIQGKSGNTEYLAHFVKA